MAQSISSGNLNNVEVSIKIGDKLCDFETMRLYQSMSSHHRFEIRVNFKPHKPSVWAVTPDEIFKQLGEKVFIKMVHNISGATTEFYGYISDIDCGGNDGNQGYVILKGGSPTILLDRDPSMGCFVNHTLQSLVSEVLGQSGINVDVSNNPKYQSIIPYVCRYRESSWNFMSRILRSYGEWFYYDGVKLVVGVPTNSSEIRASYDIELKSINIASCIQPLNIEHSDYNAERNTKYNDAPSTDLEGENSYMRIAKSKSAPFYPTVQQRLTSHAILEDEDAVRTMDSVFSRHYSQMSVYTASSDTCAIHIGEWVVMVVPKSFEGVELTDLGRLRVTEITHEYDANKGTYFNTFKGVAGATESMPNDPSVIEPTAFPEVAAVMDNNDPMNQGRVRVQFTWQDRTNTNEMSNWMRVQTPDAGSSDTVAQNRGFVFIPEIGDQVMVGFEYGNPSRPFVMGSLFHRDNTIGAADDNTLKTIITRSGSTLTFNDNAGTILLCTSNANQIFIDEQSGLINIFSDNEVNLSTRNVNIDASENMTINVGKNLDICVGEDMYLNVNGGTSVSIEKDSINRVNGDAKNIIKGKHDVVVQKDLNLNSSSNINIESDGKSTIASQKMMNIKSNDKVYITKG